MICAMLLMNMSVYAENGGKEIYVDPASLGGDGSFEKPFKTLEEARDEVRRIKQAGYPDGGITVYLRGGNYNLNNTFKLTAEDSGEENAPVIWRAYENETPNITGGARLKVGNFQVANHDSIDETVKGRVYSCNLRQMGIDGYDKLHITGHAQHYLLLFGLLTDGDTVDFGTANPEIVFEGDVVGRLAQYPNEGYMTIDRVIDPGDKPARWGESEDSYMYVPMEERHNPPIPPVFSTTDERAKRWGNAKNAWVKGYWFYDWSDQSMGVERVDAEKGIIYPKDPSGYSAKEGQRFFIYNLLEELDMPGEWYYDHETGILYIYPVNTNPENTFKNVTGTAIRLNATGRATNLNDGILNLEVYGLDGTYPFTGPAYSKYPHMANILNDNPLDPKYNIIKNNSYQNVGKEIEVNPLTSAGSTITEEEMRQINEIE